MLVLSRPLAAAIVVAASLLPGVVAIAFFGGNAGLWEAPLSPRVLAIALAASLLALLARMRALRLAGENPSLGRVLRDDGAALLVPAALIVLIAFPSAAFSFIKANIPAHVPFYLDPPLVTADRWLFLGTDPWRVSHALLGPWGTVVIDRLYVLWFTLFPFLAVWIGGSRDRTFQFRAMMGVLVVLVLIGNAMALAMSSAGPVFYERFYGDPYYAPLMARLAEADAVQPITALSIAEWLLATYDEGGFGSGISAMPSVHVGFAVLTWLMVRDRVANPWPRALAALYAFVIWVGSFHLAWHYAWDGIVSLAVVWGCWKLLGRVEVAPVSA
ncbi:phosphatase PAP2 family protein [Aurantiacibacter luteus]|uniref:Inositolphosphotransferase Aur1/Ipt1 domain-containing protein n=1 Tax=Aurantiacibacter luteus TaxID=1581420 RepID=A0A0G9N1F9_9SPHN|nr:phosphatase PAP2 family protein [Aurantiacibacter luteus]KLE35383.1 hypothetical protein AAW00_02790 [Aurantiacibacter luteus]